jgi:hypothetical protein
MQKQYAQDLAPSPEEGFTITSYSSSRILTHVNYFSVDEILYVLMNV